MGWLGAFKKKQLEPAWIFEADGDLWRLIPTINGHIFGETRNTTKKSVSFFYLDRQTGAEIRTGITLDEKWWVGIEDVCENIAFFHHFKSPDMPIHKKIIALDIHSNTILWKNEDLVFVAVANNLLYAFSDTSERRSFLELDLHTGTVLREVDGEFVNSARNSVFEQQSAFIRFPANAGQGSGMPQNVLTALGRRSGNKYQPLALESIAERDIAILKLSENMNDSAMEFDIQEKIFAFRISDGAELYSDTVSEHAGSIVPDTFLVVNDFLYYVKEKRQLVAVRLFEGGING